MKKKIKDRIKTVKIIDEDGNELNREEINFDDVEIRADGKGTVTVLHKENSDFTYYDDGLHWDNKVGAAFYFVPVEENRFYTTINDNHVLVNNYGGKYKIFYTSDEELESILLSIENRNVSIKSLCETKGYNYTYLGLVYDNGVTYDSMVDKHIERRKRQG